MNIASFSRHPVMSVFDTSIAIQQQRREDRGRITRAVTIILEVQHKLQGRFYGLTTGALDYNIQSHNGDSFLRNALVLYSLVRRSLSAFRRLRYVGGEAGDGVARSSQALVVCVYSGRSLGTRLG